MLSPMILLYVKMFLFVVPFDVWDRLWVAIRSVSEVSSDNFSLPEPKASEKFIII